ncbi:hypothetical protein [Streptomyces sp. NPDC003374]
MLLAKVVGDPGLAPFFMAAYGALIFLVMGSILLFNPRNLGDKLMHMWISVSPFRSKMLISPDSLGKVLGSVAFIAAAACTTVAVIEIARH